MIELTLATLGGIWRYVDGRGYGQNWQRVLVCFMLALICTSNMGPYWAVPLSAAWAALWVFRQKNRAEIDDMGLRWAAPVSIIFGSAFGLYYESIIPFLFMSFIGCIMAALVWAGVHMPELKFTIRKFHADSTAITETLSGFIAFGALALMGFP